MVIRRRGGATNSIISGTQAVEHRLETKAVLGYEKLFIHLIYSNLYIYQQPLIPATLLYILPPHTLASTLNEGCLSYASYMQHIRPALEHEQQYIFHPTRSAVKFLRNSKH